MTATKLNIPSEEYRSRKELSRSDLFKLSKSPAHFIYALKNPQEETAAMIFGTAFHTLVLEPEKFEGTYITVPKIDRRTKEGKAWAEKIERSGKIPLTEETVEQLRSMRTSVMSNKYAEILLRGEKEQSYFWTDELTGIDLKCRPDCRTDLKTMSVIVDLKTTENAATEAFMHSALSYGYDLQAAMYKQGVETVEKKPHKFVFIAVEKSPPYACNIIEADNVFVDKGSRDLRDYLYTVKECRASGNWYGYNGADGSPNVMGLPAWLAKEYE